MSILLKLTGTLFGAYTGLTLINIGSHWFNFKKPYSWTVPKSTATKPLSAERLNDKKELERRQQIEKNVVNLFSANATYDDMECMDEYVYFEDPMGSHSGKDSVNLILLGGGSLITELKMKDLKVERYSNAFTLTYDQSAIIFGLEIKSLPTKVYCEMNEDNTKITKIYDLWFGRPFFDGFGSGKFIRTVNGKIFYDFLLGKLVNKL